QGLARGAQVVEPVLEAGAAQVGDQDLHAITLLRSFPLPLGSAQLARPVNAATTADDGRGMTCAARNSPIREAASAPASTAARTLLTSPRTITLTTPPSSLMTWLASSTLAAFSIASTALIRPTRPSVSIRPRALFMGVHPPAVQPR